MRFDWTDLQLFVHACEAGSLTGAAQRGHLTLAAVSARIRAMESASGAPLLLRHSRGVRPTAAGEALLRHARAVLQQLAQLQDELAAHAGGDTGPLRLLANTSAMARHIAGPVAAFLRGHPSCPLAVEESPSHLSAQALREGLADAAILSDAADVEGLETQPLGDDPLVLVMAPDHPLATRRQPTFAQALEFPWVGGASHSALHAHLAMQAAALGKQLRLQAQVGHLGVVQDLVAQGVGISVLPAALLTPGAVPLRLAVKPLAERWARRRLLLCSAAGARRRPALSGLLGCFTAA